MITRGEAQAIVEKHLAQKAVEWGFECAVLVGRTQEVEGGWVFHYDSRSYIETQELRFALAGNLPLFVDRMTGHLTKQGRSRP